MDSHESNHYDLRAHLVARRIGWQRDGEGCAAAERAANDDFAAMRLDELACDGKPQAAACAFGVSAGAVAPPKAVEDKGQVVGSDAVTCIGDGDLHLIAVSVLCGAIVEGRCAEGDLSACGRVA